MVSRPSSTIAVGGRRGACDRGDRGQGGSRSDRGGNTRLRPPRLATAGQRHASAVADRALPGAGRPSDVGRCLHVVERPASNSSDALPRFRRAAPRLPFVFVAAIRGLAQGRPMYMQVGAPLADTLPALVPPTHVTSVRVG